MKQQSFLNIFFISAIVERTRNRISIFIDYLAEYNILSIVILFIVFIVG